MPTRLNNNNHLEYRSKPGYFPPKSRLSQKSMLKKKTMGIYCSLSMLPIPMYVLFAAETRKKCTSPNRRTIFRTRSMGIGIQMLEFHHLDSRTIALILCLLRVSE